MGGGGSPFLRKLQKTTILLALQGAQGGLLCIILYKITHEVVSIAKPTDPVAFDEQSGHFESIWGQCWTFQTKNVKDQWYSSNANVNATVGHWS